ncbi:MAG: AAA family ATPase [Sphaerochaetaceae bacterium]
MKLLRVEYQNINLFKEGMIVDFTASDKVVDSSQVTVISNSIKLQKVLSFAGINATGKTTALRLIDYAINLLSDNNYLAHVKMKYGILQDNSKIIIDFLLNEEIYRLESIIGIKENTIEDGLNPLKMYFYKEEKIYRKNIKSVTLKKDIFDWKNKPLYQRSSLDKKNLEMLKSNQSIIVLVTKEDNVKHFSFIDSANGNYFFFEQEINKNFYNLFDNSIDRIKFIEDKNVEIKYKNSDNICHANNLTDEYHFLSSGTIRGPLIMHVLSLILQIGGCLIIDEIEIHLNKTLVEVILDLFKDEKTNPNGAVIIFSTHYLEILDTMDRKDNIYVTRKDKNFNLSVTKFSDKIKRNDIKKSEVLLSNYFENTAPKYEIIQKIKEDLRKKLK